MPRQILSAPALLMILFGGSLEFSSASYFFTGLRNPQSPSRAPAVEYGSAYLHPHRFFSKRNDGERVFAH
jgi:hypothetical protein